MSKTTTKTQTQTIKQKMAQLDELVQWFESDEFTLEESFEKFEAAQKLAEEIEQDLQTFSNNVTVLAKRFDEA